jgi:hypothetical protein
MKITSGSMRFCSVSEELTTFMLTVDVVGWRLLEKLDCITWEDDGVEVNDLSRVPVPFYMKCTFDENLV